MSAALLLALAGLFAILYWVLWALFLGIRDNYFRYYQKADLQWTGPGNKPPRSRIRLTWLIFASLLSALLVSHWMAR